MLADGTGYFTASELCEPSSDWIRVSISRTEDRYSSSLFLSEPPSEDCSRRASSSTPSRILFSYISWRRRCAGSTPRSRLPNRRSKTERGRTSGGRGEVGVCHERVLL